LLGKTHDVSIFEARSEPGFAGLEARLPNGRVIDIPLRMIEPHYWKKLVNFCHELGVPLIGTHFTTALHGFQKNVKTELSLFQTLCTNTRHYASIGFAALRLCFVSARKDETIAAFMDRMNLLDSDFYRIYVRRHLSWVLSCTYEMVDSYPAELVVGFFRAIQGNFFREGNPTMRIDPSVKRLQDALLAGKTIHTGQPVPAFTEGRTLNGEAFDAVVIATEAAAVPKLLLRDWASCFSRFKYHPSHVIVHRDTSLMPEDKETWRAVNVCDDPSGKACQITVWVNAYYEAADLGGDVFETVNPCHRPKEELIIKEVHMQRVVHNVDSAELQAEIEAIQGREGFYFCGAYSVPGMGLLEQACSSAHAAVAAVRRDMGMSESRTG